MQPRVRRRTLTTSASNAHTLVSTTLLGIAGIFYLLIPGALGAAAVGVIDGGFAPIWAIGLTLGGAMASTGILRAHPRLEVIGLALLGGSVTFAAVAVIDVRATTAWPTAVIYLSSGLSCLFRMWAVVFLERLRDRLAHDALTVFETRP